MANYYVWSGASAGGNGTTWALAYQTLTLAFAGKAAGDTFFVAHDHNETTAAALSLTTTGTLAAPTKAICVDRAGSVPPVSADRRSTAQVAVTGINNMTFVGAAYYSGIIFSSGNAANVAHIILTGLPATNAAQRFDNCSLRLLSTSISPRIFIGNSGASSGAYVEFNNTTVSFANIGQSLDMSGMFRWRNTPSAVLGTVPTNLLSVQTPSRGAVVECNGVDFSAMTAGKILLLANSSSGAHTYKFVDCKLDAAVTKVSGTFLHGSCEADFMRCGATGNYAVSRYRVSGQLDQETSVVRTAGASDGTTPISWKVVTTLICSYLLPFECPPIAIWCDTPGVVTPAEIECAWGAGSPPNNDEVWLDLEYLGDVASPQGSFVNDGKADLLVTAAPQSASAAAWAGSVSKFKLDVSFTPQQKGWIYARVKCARPSMTFYIDPKISMLSTVPPEPPAAVTMATFDGTPAAGVVMSNGNLTVTHGTTNNGTGVKSLATKYTGKYFFEIKLTVSTTNANGGGIVPSPGGAFSDAVNFAGGFGASYGSGSSLIYTDGVNTTKNLGVAAVGDVFSYAIDLSARLGWVRRNFGLWNNDAAADPATGIGGVAIPAGALAPFVRFTNGAATDVLTGNFGATQLFNSVVPPGFTAGWPPGAEPAPPVVAAWNPADKSAAVTLSNSNLTVTTSGNNTGARTTVAASSGKLYFEISSTGISGYIGLGLAAMPFNATTSAVGVAPSSGWIQVNGASVLNIGGLASTVSVAVDLDAKRIWFRSAPSGNWNANATYNPATNVGGVDISALSGPLYPMVTALLASNNATANFGASAFSGAMPAGFTSVWPGT